MRRFLLILVPAVIVLFGLTSCPGNEDDPTDVVFPDDSVSYKEHVQPLIAYNCALSNCHGVICGNNANPLYNYFYLVKSDINIGVVVANYPDASRLVQIFEYKGAGHTPFYKWSLNENQRQGIRKWIEEGAKDN